MVNTTAKTAGGTVKRQATYGNGLIALIVGIALVTITSQVHHHYAPHSSSGWRELPYYVISGAIGYAVAFGLGLLRVRRGHSTKTIGQTALVLGAVGVVLFGVAWYTPIPFVFGAGAVLLGRDGVAAGGRGRLNNSSVVLGALAMLGTVAMLAYRVVEAISH